MARKFYCQASYGSLAEHKEFDEHQYDEMIAWVTQIKEQRMEPLDVIFGERLEFEPRDVVKTWGVVGWGK